MYLRAREGHVQHMRGAIASETVLRISLRPQISQRLLGRGVNAHVVHGPENKAGGSPATTYTDFESTRGHHFDDLRVSVNERSNQGRHRRISGLRMPLLRGTYDRVRSDIIKLILGYTTCNYEIYKKKS